MKIRSIYFTFISHANGYNQPVTVTLYWNGASETRDANGALVS